MARQSPYVQNDFHIFLRRQPHWFTFGNVTMDSDGSDHERDDFENRVRFLIGNLVEFSFINR